MPPKRIRLKVDITSGQAVDFINKLALDDQGQPGIEFRTSFLNDPVAMLAYYGIEASPELLPETIELPTSEEMQGVLAISPGSPVSVEGTASSLFPIFCLIFPHVALRD